MLDLLIVSSPGGHLETAKFLTQGINFKFKYVIHDAKANKINGIKVLHAPHSDRDIKILSQILYAIKIMILENPKIIISTGAGIAVSFFLIGKIFRKKLIFIESATRINELSLSGKICYLFADRFYVRYPGLLKKYPKAIFIKESI